MKRYFLILMLITSCIFAQDETKYQVEGPSNVEVGKLVTFQVALHPNENCFWEVIPLGTTTDIRRISDPRVSVLNFSSGITSTQFVVCNYRWRNENPDEQVIATYTIVVVGIPKPPEPPTPPEPPIPPPVVPGKKTILFFRESNNSTPEVAHLITSLRIGDFAKYIKEKNHTLLVLDPVDENGQTPPGIEQWKEYIGTLPYMIMVDTSGTSNKIVWKGEVPKTSQEVLDLLKKNGG